MAENKNTTQNLITAFSIIIALVAVVYALMMHIEKPTNGNDAEPVAVMAERQDEPTITEQNPVVLEINGDEVTRVEVLNNFMQSGSQLPPGAALDQIFPLLQEQYVMSQLIINAAEDNGIDENHPEVQDRLRKARDQAVRAVYMQQIGEAAVTDADVQNAYNDIIANAPDVTERKARHILVETQEAANALIIRLEQGADFAKLAEENSTGPTAENGGDLGFFTKEQMVPEFAEAAFDLEIGEYTKTPVQTQFGWHVILAEEERTRPKPEFADVREQLAAQLRQAATQQKIQELRQNADITLYTVNGEEVEQVSEEQPAAGEPETTEEAEASATPEESAEETPATNETE